MSFMLRLVSLIVLLGLPISTVVATAQDGGIASPGQLPKEANSLVVETAKGTFPFSIELALDDNQRAKGLMFRTRLAEDHGMLFDFGQTRPIYMWMKNTYVSLDMVFLLEDGTVHHIVEKTTPLSQSIIGSGGPVRFVLEVKAGTIKRTGLAKGDRLQHILFTPKL